MCPGSSAVHAGAEACIPHCCRCHQEHARFNASARASIVPMCVQSLLVQRRHSRHRRCRRCGFPMAVHVQFRSARVMCLGTSNPLFQKIAPYMYIAGRLRIRSKRQPPRNHSAQPAPFCFLSSSYPLAQPMSSSPLHQPTHQRDGVQVSLYVSQPSFCSCPLLRPSLMPLPVFCTVQYPRHVPACSTCIDFPGAHRSDDMFLRHHGPSCFPPLQAYRWLYPRPMSSWRSGFGASHAAL